MEKSNDDKTSGRTNMFIVDFHPQATEQEEKSPTITEG
jgi:hypothetical protein